MAVKRTCALVGFVCLTALPVQNGAFGQAATTPGEYKTTGVTLNRWIHDLQFTATKKPSYGAIKVHHTPGAAAADGRLYFRVSPYIGDLAALGMLAAAKHNHEGPLGPNITFVSRWISWYFAHLSGESAEDGVPYEHFYLDDGSGETICVKPGDPRLCRYNDATDSAAATFFSVLREYVACGGNASVFSDEKHEKAIDGLANTLLKLQKPDGLMWAKQNYRAKYLEDNCEVYDGLVALAFIERSVYHKTDTAARYARAVERVRTGILTELWDAPSQSWRVAKFEDGTYSRTDLSKWFPDMQAQFWPLLFGAVSPADPKSQGVIKSLNEHFNGSGGADWAVSPDKVNGGFINSDCAYAALLAGDRKRVAVYMHSIEALKLSGPPETRFSWPITASDAAWLLRIVAALD